MNKETRKQAVKNVVDKDLMMMTVKMVKKRTLDVLPAGRDLRLERACKEKCFLALTAEWPERPAEVSAKHAAGAQREKNGSTIYKNMRL